MLQITNDFKTKIFAALQDVRGNYSGSDSAFSKQWGINHAVYSRLKSGEIDGLLKDTQWLNIGRELGVSLTERKWNIARTDVFTIIERDVEFCQTYAKGKMCVDDCGIGKTYSAKYLARTRKNCFYVDASQAKGVHLLIKAIAKAIGVDTAGKYADIKANIKYCLKNLPTPIVIIDEAGDLNPPALLEIKELWNATEGACGWYLMGADGFKKIMDKGMYNKKPGFKELFSRLSERYTTTVPMNPHEKSTFYRKLITDVLSANMPDKSRLNEIVKKCLTVDGSGQIGGLRRAESLLIINS
jgi:hypothetical protein